VLLVWLAQTENGRVRIAELVRPLGQPPSAVLRQLIVLEKIGLVVRDGVSGDRYVVLRPAGHALANAAHETAGSICTEAVALIASAAVGMASAALVTLARAPSLAFS
jgi:DNA-binding IclR family transcriptional regulator